MLSLAMLSARWLLALVLAASAIGKAGHRVERAEFTQALRIGLRMPRARLVAGAWIVAEGFTAIGLVLPVTAGCASVLAVGIFWCLTTGAALLASQHRQFACNCFGIGQSQLGWATVLRNGLLTAAALLLVVGPRLQGAAAAPAAVLLAAALAPGLSLLILRSLPAAPADGRPAGHVTLPASGPDVGSPAPPFTGRTSTGVVLDTAVLAGRSYLLAFVSSTCVGCRGALPGMVGYAGQLPGGFSLITVIVGDPRRGGDIEQTLAPVATVVSEPDGGPISTAYRIRLFPSYVLISDTGTVLATGQSVRDLPQPQPQ